MEKLWSRRRPLHISGLPVEGKNWDGKKVLGAQAKFWLDRSGIRLTGTGPKQRAGHIYTADEENQVCDEVIPLCPQECASPWALLVGEWRKEPADLLCHSFVTNVSQYTLESLLYIRITLSCGYKGNRVTCLELKALITGEDEIHEVWCKERICFFIT